MDEDSELDKELDSSLVDLHHGLDSSVDESAGGEAEDGSQCFSRSHSQDTLNEEEMAGDQMNVLQDMVLEMKQGFQSALEELAKIQDKEEGEASYSRRQQQQQQQQLDGLTEVIHEIKNQLLTLTKSMDEMKDEQKTLKNHLDEVRSNRGSSQESKSRGEGDRPDLLDDFSASAEEWNNKLLELPNVTEDRNSEKDNDITAVACKSLSLTQALGEKCLNLNLSQSSDDDERIEQRRLSQYAHKAGQLLQEETANRRHSMPASATSQGRNKDILSAANRQKAVKELADSERDYCSQLWALLHTYLTPLQTAGFLSVRELGVLFPPYLDQLYAEHCHICTALQERLVHWTHMVTIADLFAKDSLLSLYKEYEEDLPDAVSCLRRALALSSQFRSFLRAIKHSSCQSEDLMPLIMAPVQHIPKFLLQLQEVSRHTSPTHPDYPLLQTSLHRLRTFVDQLNVGVSNTIQALSQNYLSRSGGDGDPVLSARDSGVHSNSAEEDNLTSARAFSKAERGHVLPEWIDDPYASHHFHSTENIQGPWQLQPSSARFSTLSQPDLTVYKNLNSLSPDQRLLGGHIPRSQSALPSNISSEGGDEVIGRQHRKYKVKKRNQSPGGYSASTHEHYHCNLPSRARPSSAIDFLSHSHHHLQQQHQQQQQYHQYHHYRDPLVQHRGYQYPGPQPRPHSAFGSHAIDRQHKPIIISRKHQRRSQPSMLASSNYPWETTASLSRVGHLKGHLSAHDLLPTQRSPYQNSDLMDGDDDDDDEGQEDDTRASDTHSLGTSGSHPHSSSHCSNDGHDLEMDLYTGHHGNSASHNPDLTNDITHSTEFSPAEVAASLAQKLCTDTVDMRREEEVFKLRASTSSSQSSKVRSQIWKLSPTSKENSKDQGTKEVQSAVCTEKDNAARMICSPDLAGPLSENHEREITNEIATLKPFLSQQNSLTSTLASQIVAKDTTDVPSSESSSIQIINDSSVSNIDRNTEKAEIEILSKRDECRHISENNRQFLLSLASKTIDTSSKTVNVTSSLASIESDQDSSKLYMKRRRSGPTIDSSHNSKSDIGHSLPQPYLRGSKSSISTTDKPVVMNGSDSHDFHQIRLSYPAHRGQLENQSDDLNRLVIPNAASPSYREKEKDIQSSPNNRSSYSKQPLETDLDTPKIDDDKRLTFRFTCDDPNSYPDGHEAPLEIGDLASIDKDEMSKRELRRKVKDGSEGLPKTSDDLVGTRKKMHFKTSIKNLFTKKKGRVILADVEREVVMQMATEAAAATTTTTTSPTICLPMVVASPKVAYSRSRKNGSLKGLTFHEVSEKNAFFCNAAAAFEIRTKRDQASSTSSPVKVSKMFHVQVRPSSEKQPKHEKYGSRELSTVELEQLQQHQHSLEQLKNHNKRYGLVVQNPDTHFVSIAHSGSTKPIEGRSFHFLSDTSLHTKKDNFQNQSLSQDSHDHGETHENARNKSIVSFSQGKETNCMEVTESGGTGQSKVVVGTENDSSRRHRSETQDQALPEQPRLTKQDRIRTDSQQEESNHRGSHSGKHSLCQQCQNCQTGKRNRGDAASKTTEEKSKSSEMNLMMGDSINRNDGKPVFPGAYANDSRDLENMKPQLETKNVHTCIVEHQGHQKSLNDKKNVFLPKGKLSHFAKPGNDSGDFSVSNCLKPCVEVIHMYDSSRNKVMTSSCPLSTQEFKKKRERGGMKSKLGALSPVCEEQHSLVKSPQSLVPPEAVETAARRSTKDRCDREPTVLSQDWLLNPSTSKACNGTDAISQGRKPLFRISSKAFENKCASNSSSNSLKTCSQVGGCEIKSADSSLVDKPVSEMDVNDLKNHSSSPLKRLSNNGNTSLHNVQGIKLQTIAAPNEQLALNGKEPPKSERSTPCEEATATTANQYSLEDSVHFEQKYRLYYDDELSSSNHSSPEDKKHFNGTHVGSVSNEGMGSVRSALHLIDHKDVYRHQRQNDKIILHNPFPAHPVDVHVLPRVSVNDCCNGHSISVCEKSDSSMKCVPNCLDTNVTTPNDKNDLTLVSVCCSESYAHRNSSCCKAIPNLYNPQSLSPLSNYKPCPGSLMVAGNVQQQTFPKTNTTVTACDNPNSIHLPPEASEERGGDRSNQVDRLSSSLKTVVIPVLQVQKDNDSVVRYAGHEVSSSSKRPASTPVLSASAAGEIATNEMSSLPCHTKGSQCSSNSVVYDESCSYKPKNSQPVSANVECFQSGGLSRPENASSLSRSCLETCGNGTITEQPPSASLPLPHGSSGEQRDSNPPIPTAPIALTLSDVHKQESGRSDLLRSHTYSNTASAVSGMDGGKGEPMLLHSGKNGYKSNHHHHHLLRPESYPCKLPSSDPFDSGTRSFLRTSSPHDFFSILPYKDYTLSNTSSDSSTLVASESDGHTTPGSVKSSFRTKSNGLTKSKRPSSDKISKKGHDLCGGQVASPQFTSNAHQNFQNADGDQHLHLARQSKHTKQNDGVILRARDQYYYPLEFPQSSRESGSLISSAFLQKMSHLPPHPAGRSAVHSQADHLGLPHPQHSRHAPGSAEFVRKPIMSNGEEVSAMSSGKSSHSARPVSSPAVRTSASAQNLTFGCTGTEAPPRDLQQSGSQSAGETNLSYPSSGNAKASPDLLPLNNSMKDKSSTSRKAQSFFSRLTHSPMSFFSKDPKPANLTK